VDMMCYYFCILVADFTKVIPHLAGSPKRQPLEISGVGLL